jgi:PAS domain S-box-containing protein
MGDSVMAEDSGRRRAEAVEVALQDSEALYHSLVEHLPMCIYRIDLEGRVTFGNSAYLKDVGRPLQEVLGKTVFDIFPEEEARKYDADDRQVIETGEVFRDVEEHEAHGEKLYVEVLKSLVRDHEGHPVGVQGMYWDVTARKRAEEQLRKTLAELEQSNRALQDSEALYHSLVEHLPMCVYRIDLEGQVTFGNSAYLKDIGRPFQEVLGKTVFNIFPEEEAKKYDADDRQVIETGEVFRDVEQHEAHGQKLYVEVLKSLVRDHEGHPVGVQGLYWDVTARKRAEEQLRKTLAELERSNKELQQFAAVASHDMNAPLRRVVTISRLIKQEYEKQLDADARELLGFILSSVEQMQELIEDLLAHSRVGARDKPLKPVDCDSVVSEVLSNLDVPIRESLAEIQVGRLPTVMANRVELVQLFQNLIGNAVKYRGEATPRVDVRAESKPSEWLFRVNDNGIGIAQEHLENVFDAFRRLHGDEKYSGTGIGLATCKKIVERLDGRIWVESQVGKGSEFIFVLPRTALPTT